MPRKATKRKPASAHTDLRAGDPFSVKPRKAIPHEFVLDALAPVAPWTRPMFGCTAIYVGERIVLILRQKPTYERDNGVLLVTTREHHGSLRRDFPNLRSVEFFGEPVSNWQILPIDAPDFEESAMRACELVIAGDPRIGKVPNSKKAKKSKKAVKPARSGRTSKSKDSKRR